jgi:hypothetical protein
MLAATVLEDDLTHGFFVVLAPRGVRSRGIGGEPRRDDPASLGSITRGAPIGPQVRGVLVPGTHDGGAATKRNLRDGIAEGDRHAGLVQRPQRMRSLGEYVAANGQGFPSAEVDGHTALVA